MGSALIGSLQITCFLTEVPFGYQSVKIYQHLSTSVYFLWALSPSVKTHYFCSDPISVDPICPQPKGLHGLRLRRAARALPHGALSAFGLGQGWGLAKGRVYNSGNRIFLLNNRWCSRWRLGITVVVVLGITCCCRSLQSPTPTLTQMLPFAQPEACGGRLARVRHLARRRRRLQHGIVYAIWHYSTCYMV